MGFEIITKSKGADLTILFDQEAGMSITGKELHASLGKDAEEIRKIYDEALALAATQPIETLEVTIMHHAGMSEPHVYPIAFEAISQFLAEHELNVYLNLEISNYYQYNRVIERDLFTDIQKIVAPIFTQNPARESSFISAYKEHVNPSYQHINPQIAPDYDNFYFENRLDEMLKQSKPVSFGERLVQLIDEKGYAKDSLVYNKAIVDRRLYHNIISKENYLPKKNTVILFALALELDEEEAIDFLGYAGYSFSSSRKDQVILFCIRNHYYNIMKINGYLYDKGLPELLNID